MSKHQSNTDRSFFSRTIIRHCLLVATTAAAISIGSSSATASSSTDTVATISAGDGNTCAVTVAGNVKCWGHDDAGQLGRGDSVWTGEGESPGALEIIDLGGLAQRVHTNGQQTYAVLSTGIVRAWGANENGQLGLGHTETIGDDETPATADVAVDVELGDAVTQLAVGDDFACALLDGGAVRCWGANDVGQLGYGHTATIGDDESPVDVDAVQLGGDAVSLAAGAHHACALLDSGVVRCWGLGESGQLGYGSNDDVGDDELPSDRDPVAVGGTVVELVAGEGHTCARLEEGAVRCWGANDVGQLGYGHTTAIGDDESPESAGDVSVGGTATALAAGAQHTCALLTGGFLRCWGAGLDGRLGHGSDSDVGDDETPADVDELDFGGRVVTSVFIGPTASSTCAGLDDGAVRCWGLDDVGQLGYGDTASRGDTPTTTPDRIPDVIIIIDDSTD